MNARRDQGGFSLLECLVYISVLAVVLTLAYPTFYRAMKGARDLRRNADDIARALHAGERWRGDVRAVTAAPRAEAGALILPRRESDVVYSFEAGAIWRKDARGKVRVLRDVKASRMETVRTEEVNGVVWRWELELASSEPAVRIRPLFTFQAVGGLQP